MALPTDYTPTENDRAHAERCMEQARLLAAAYLPELLTTMVEKALDPTATPKVVLDAADFTYRVSGMAKKQEDKPTGPSFQVKIVLPGSQREITIGAGSTDEQDILDVVPTHVTRLNSAASDLLLGDYE